MPSFRSMRRVAYSPRQMFDIVADVERYPEFVPMCESLRVLSREEGSAGTTLMATMAIGYKSIRESFTTRVLLAEADPSITVSYVDGPFRRLENRWRFVDAPQGSDVDFFIDYEFRSHMLALVMGAVFDKAFRRFAEVFEERARAVYGSQAT